MASLSNGVQFQVEGIAALKAKLRRMSGDLRRKLLIKGANAAADVYKTAAEAAAPVRKGILKKSFGKRVRPGGDFRASVGVGVYGADAYYASWVEFGHGPKRIRRGKRSRTSPGTLVAKPHPFLRPAFDTKSDAAAQAAHEVILAGLENA